MNKKQAYAMGVEHGFNVASWQELPELSTVVKPFETSSFIGKIETAADAKECFLSVCFDAEENSRQYFSIVAHELNSYANADSLWESFDAGIQRGFEKNWRARSKGFYAKTKKVKVIRCG